MASTAILTGTDFEAIISIADKARAGDMFWKITNIYMASLVKEKPAKNIKYHRNIFIYSVCDLL